MIAQRFIAAPPRDSRNRRAWAVYDTESQRHGSTTYTTLAAACRAAYRASVAALDRRAGR